MTPIKRRGTAYGVFNTGFGIFWFLGSAAMGVLYDLSIPVLIAFSVLLQFASIPLFLMTSRIERKVVRWPNRLMATWMAAAGLRNSCFQNSSRATHAERNAA